MKIKPKFVAFLILPLTAVVLNAQENSTPADSSSIRIQHSTHSYGAKSQNSDWVITTNILLRQPHWSGLSPGPPLSKSNAVSIALAEAKSHHTDIHDWKIENVLMWNLSWNKKFKNLNYCSNVWYYLVSVEPADDQKSVELTDSGQDFDLDQIVLMDGTLVKNFVEPVTYLQTRLMRDARTVITKTTNGPVAIDELPDSIRGDFDLKRAFVTNNVLVIFTSEKNGKILNPASAHSIPNLNGFTIVPDDEFEPGVFGFKQ
jgi:hypothetical protein